MAKKRSTATRRQESQAASARAAAIRKEAERKERRRRSLVVSGVVVAVLAIVLVIGYLVQNSRDSTGQAAGSTPSGAVGHSLPVGASSAKTTVTIYEDFMCPYCGQLESATRSKLQSGIDAGHVRVRYHVLNFLDRSSSTQYSLRSANAMAVVFDTSGSKVAKKFHDLLYENQPQEGSAGLSDGQLVDYAVQAGASRSAVAKGISARTYQQWVKNGTAQASKDGVTGTPTVQIDGQQVQGSLAQIAQRIDQAVAAAR